MDANKVDRWDPEELLKAPFRMILSERDERHIRPLTEYPTHGSRLPSDLRMSLPLDTQRPQIMYATESASLSSLPVADFSQFGRQAQAVSLLDRVLSITCFATANEHNTLLELADLVELDGEIRSFLSAIMEEAAQPHTPQLDFSAAVALSIK